MPLDSTLTLASLLVTLCCLTLAWHRRRHQRHRTQLLRGSPRNTFRTSYALSNALQVLQQITQPAVQHVLIQKNDEDAESDEDGDPPSPSREFHRQMTRIRRGEQIGRLRIRLP